jgi:hypothetical protein
MKLYVVIKSDYSEIQTVLAYTSKSYAEAVAKYLGYAEHYEVEVDKLPEGICSHKEFKSLIDILMQDRDAQITQRNLIQDKITDLDQIIKTLYPQTKI